MFEILVPVVLAALVTVELVMLAASAGLVRRTRADGTGDVMVCRGCGRRLNATLLTHGQHPAGSARFHTMWITALWKMPLLVGWLTTHIELNVSVRFEPRRANAARRRRAHIMPLRASIARS